MALQQDAVWHCAVLSWSRPEGQVCSPAAAGLMADCQQDPRGRFLPPALEAWQSLRQPVACWSKLVQAVGRAGLPTGRESQGLKQPCKAREVAGESPFKSKTCRSARLGMWSLGPSDP